MIVVKKKKFSKKLEINVNNLSFRNTIQDFEILIRL